MSVTVAGVVSLVKGGAAAVSTLKTFLSLREVPDSITKLVRTWKGRPTDAERDVLVHHARRMDARRVFDRPFDVEVVDACLYSLDEVRLFTDEAASRLKHPGARVMMLAILSDVRTFLDRWQARRPKGAFHLPMKMEAESAEFFKDLGTLRERVRTWRSILVSIEPALGEATDDV